jgi:hypothetical protein
MRSRRIEAARLQERLVHRAREQDGPLLARALQRYAEAEGLSWQELAQSLGCTEEALNQVALCLPPRPEWFVADVEAIAGEYVRVEPLLALLRRLQVLNAFAEEAEQAGPSAGETALLMAARDREAEAQEREPDEGDRA